MKKQNFQITEMREFESTYGSQTRPNELFGWWGDFPIQIIRDAYVEVAGMQASQEIAGCDA